MQHKVTLTNGRILLVEESKDAVHIAAVHEGNIDAYICEINASGVLVMSNSGSAGEYLVTDLPTFKPLDQVYWADPDGLLCSKYGTVDSVRNVDGVCTVVTLQDGTECLPAELRHVHEFE
jgi:hypothetical protein